MKEKLRINKMILKIKIQLKCQQFAHISVFQQTTRVFFIAYLIFVNYFQKINMIVIACKECRRSSSPTLRNGTPLFLRFPHWPHGLYILIHDSHNFWNMITSYVFHPCLEKKPHSKGNKTDQCNMSFHTCFTHCLTFVIRIRTH